MRTSVVVATYRSSLHLVEQLTSILMQTRPVDEIIVTDDGSDDDTLEVARSVLADGPPHRILADGVNRGVLSNYERGLRAATGDLVFLSDHDDVWASGKVAAAATWFANHPDTLMWFSDARLIDDDGALLSGTLWARLAFDDAAQAAWADGGATAILMRSSVVTGATAAVTRQLLDVALPLPTQGWHDAWMVQLAAAIGDVRADPTCHVDYRLHGANVVGLRFTGLRRRWAARPRDYRAELRALTTMEELVSRLRGVGAAPTQLDAWEARAAHLRRRLAAPDVRVARIPMVLQEARAGGYSRYSEGAPAAIWDVLRPIGPRASRRAASLPRG